MLVCRGWHDAIVNSPRLWRYLDNRMSPGAARIAVERSALLGMDAYWISTETWDQRATVLCKMFEENLSRIRSMQIENASRGHIPSSLLSGKTPKLERLRVAGTEQPHRFKLSRGPPLKYLDLDNMMTNLHSSRLSGLRTLVITGFAVPDAEEELFLALRGMKQLEILWIRNVPGWNAQRTQLAPATLPRLKSLVLGGSRSTDHATILANLITPACSDILVSDREHHLWTEVQHIERINPLVWCSESIRTAVLFGAGDSGPRCDRLMFRITRSKISIKSNWKMQRARDRIDSGDITPRPGSVQLKLKVFEPGRLLTNMAEAAAQLALSCPRIDLHIYSKRCPHNITRLDLLPWTQCLRALCVTGSDLCRNVLQQLRLRVGEPVDFPSHPRYYNNKEPAMNNLACCSPANVNQNHNSMFIPDWSSEQEQPPSEVPERPPKKQRFSSLKTLHFRRPSVSSQVENAPLIKDKSLATGRVADLVLEEERRLERERESAAAGAGPAGHVVISEPPHHGGGQDEREHDAQGPAGEQPQIPSEKESRPHFLTTESGRVPPSYIYVPHPTLLPEHLQPPEEEGGTGDSVHNNVPPATTNPNANPNGSTSMLPEFMKQTPKALKLVSMKRRDSTKSTGGKSTSKTRPETPPLPDHAAAVVGAARASLDRRVGTPQPLHAHTRSTSTTPLPSSPPTKTAKPPLPQSPPPR
ncbi:hypothetical protein FRB90_006355, partial [Tulasnella sp. 427]